MCIKKSITWIMEADKIQSLLERITLGDEQSFKTFVSYYATELTHLACSITGNIYEAEEIVADVYIKIWYQRAKLSEIKSIRFYLYTLTKNMGLDYVRKFHKRRFFELDEIQLPKYSVSLTPENLLISAEMAKKINSVINELPPKCKLIFKLVKEDGLKHKEAAELLNLNIKTIEAQIGIALKRIHTSIKIYLPQYQQQ
jgi:RNA polymerase sigma-19 factor, ECF subfamily